MTSQCLCRDVGCLFIKCSVLFSPVCPVLRLVGMSSSSVLLFAVLCVSLLAVLYQGAVLGFPYQLSCHSLLMYLLIIAFASDLLTETSIISWFPRACFSGAFTNSFHFISLWAGIHTKLTKIFKILSLYRVWCCRSREQPWLLQPFFILWLQGHEKIILSSRDNSLFSCDNEIIYQVSFRHMIKSKCVVHDHTDLARLDHSVLWHFHTCWCWWHFRFLIKNIFLKGNNRLFYPLIMGKQALLLH